MDSKQNPNNQQFTPTVLTPGNYTQTPPLPPELSSEPISYNTQQSTSGGGFRLNTVKQLAILAAVFLVILAPLGYFGYENSRAASLLESAKTSLADKKYDTAMQQLDKAGKYFSFGSTKRQISDLSKKDIAWIADKNYYDQAAGLVKQGKYNEAKALLAKIGDDYPDYQQVKALTAQIAQQPVPMAVQIKPLTNKPAPSASQATKPAPTPASAKRFVSTAALSALASAGSVAQAQQALSAFLSQYGVNIEIANVSISNYASQFTTYKIISAGDLGELKSYGAAFIDEWAKYPKDWVQNSGLKDVIMVTDLAVQGTNRAAMPDIGGYDMYYDVGYGSGDYAREVIHHEYDHLITYHYYQSYQTTDSAWLTYNPPGFSYGNGGASCYQPGNNCLTGEHPVPGFVSGYAASAIEEDQAELFGYLMETTYYHHLKGWLPGDPYLVKKVNNYKQFIASHSPEMSGSYFDQINP